MGIQKRYLREVDTAGSYSNVQALTSTSTGTTILAYGLTTINSGSTTGTNAYAMAAPLAAGVHKDLAITVGTTEDVTVSLTTAVSFFGSTDSTVVFSTGTGEKHLALIASSAIKWAVVGSSTGVTFSG